MKKGFESSKKPCNEDGVQGFARFLEKFVMKIMYKGLQVLSIKTCVEDEKIYLRSPSTQ